MSKSEGAGLVAAVAVLCMSSWAMADAAGDYQGLFGAEEKAAAAKGAKAAPEFAAKLLDAARSARAQKELQGLLCEKAYEFGIKAPAGYPAAAEAMKLLIEAGGNDKAAAQDKLLKVSELRLKSAKDDRKQIGQELVDLLIAFGDERAEAKQTAEAVTLYRRAQALATSVQSDRAQQVADRIKKLNEATEAEKRIAAQRAQLVRDPKNTPLREKLILACLGELNDPNEAAKLVTADVNEGLRTYVPLAAKKVEDLAEGVCLDLAEWYVATVEKVSGGGRGNLLSRAQACCERYLELHQAEDASRIKSKMLLAKVDKALETEGGGPARQIVLTLAKGVTMKLVRIPAGKFLIGSPDTEAGRGGDESPRLVTISKPFYMGVYEVTQPQYEAVMGRNPSTHKVPGNPVENVKWDDAAEFCKKLSEKARRTVRLPTEAEWEYACRAGTKTAYYFGNDAGKLGDYAWFDRNADKKPHEAGQKKPNPAGLYDMYGNIAEWCSGWYADSYAKGKAVDPQGADSGKDRIVRGGACREGPSSCRSAHRGRVGSDWWHDDIGFRVVAGVD
jgi:formylglycine-generating enzyme required for sulfatase activity